MIKELALYVYSQRIKENNTNLLKSWSKTTQNIGYQCQYIIILQFITKYKSMLHGVIRCCNCINYKLYKIMIDPLGLYSRKSSFITNTGSSELQQKVMTLEQQIENLNKIILEKDQIFNTIMLAYDAAKFKNNQLMIAIDYYLTQLRNDQKQCQQIDPYSTIEQTEDIKKLAEIVLNDLQRILNVHWDNQSCTQQTNKILSIVKGLRLEGELNDNLLDQNQNKKIYQVPVEMIVFQDLVQSELEADFSQRRSYVYEVPVQFYSIQEIPVQLGQKEIFENEIIKLQRKIYEVSVQMDKIQQIPGLLDQYIQFPIFLKNRNNTQDFIFEVPKQNNLIQEHERLYNQITRLKQQIQILKQQLSLKKENVILIEVPVQLIQIIQTPIELEPFQVEQIQKPINCINVQAQTDQYESPKNENSQKQIILRQVPIEVVVQRIVQVSKQVIIQRTTMQLIQVPTEVIIEKKVVIQVQKWIPILVPILKQVPIEVQIINQSIQIEKMVPVFVPIVKEIPIQVEIQVKKEVIKQVKTLVEVPVIVYLQTEKPDDSSDQKQELKYVQNLKLVQKSNFLQHQGYQIKNTNILDQKYNIVQLPIQILIQKEVEVQKLVQRIIEKEVIFQKIIQVHLEKIVEVQKIVEKEVIKYVIKQILVECIIQSPVKINQQAENKVLENHKVNNKEQYVQTLNSQKNSIAINTDPLESKITIFELPIELQLIENQLKQREVQLQHQQLLNYMKQKYESEINQLNSIIKQMQRAMLQKQADLQSLQQKIQVCSLEIKELYNKHISSIQTYQKKLAQTQYNLEQVLIQNKQNNTWIQQMQRQLLNKRDVKDMATIYQTPVQLNKAQKFSESSQQTEQIDLFNYIQFIEIPVQIQHTMQISHRKLVNAQNQYFLNQSAKHVTYQDDCKLKKIQYEILQTQQALSGSQLQQIQAVKEQMHAEIIQYYQDYQFSHEIDQHVSLQPSMYEVSLKMNVMAYNSDVQVQTDFEQIRKIEYCIYQVPINMVQIQYYQNIQQEEQIKDLQLEKIHLELLPFKKKYNTQQLRSALNDQDRQQGMYETPFNIKIKEPLQNVLQTVAKCTQTQALILSNVKQFQINEVFQVSQLKKESAYLKFSIFHDIQNIAITPAQQHILAQQIPRQRQKKIQNQILRLGSDITVNFHNNSHVQSLTPGGMFASLSSYEKFPPPHINNISLIKKDSFTQGKFFGSLDIRQEILSREDPIASLRLANKKLTGFQQESSDGDSHNISRQMIIEQNQTIVSKDINRIHTPNLEPHDLNFSQYAKFQQNKYQFQQEHRNYLQQNQILSTKIVKLQNQINDYKEKIKQLENHVQQLQQEYQSNIQKLQNELETAKNSKECLDSKLKEYQTSIEENQYAKSILQKQNQFLIQNFQKLKEESQRNERESQKQVQHLHNLVLDRENQVKETKIQAEHLKNIYNHQINQFKEYLISSKEEIQKLYEELQYKNQKIDQLQGTIEQIRKSMDLMIHLQNDTSDNYEQEIETIRCEFEQHKRQKQQAIEELKTQIQRINGQMFNQQNKNKKHQEFIYELQRDIQQIKSENSRLNQLKNQIEENYIVCAKQLKGQTQQMKIQIFQKEEIIQKQNYIIQNLQLKAKKQLTKIQYIQPIIDKHNSQNLRQIQQYCKQLQSIILKYEKKLIKNSQTIEELQEKLCEYLSDALDKQQLAQNLHLKLISYENTINELLLVKLNLQLQNKRHKKSIQQAEKKFKLMGKKLIEVARQKAEYDSYEDDECQV